MAFNLFGLILGKNPGKDPDDKPANTKAVSFVAPDYDDGAYPVEAGGYYGAYVDFDGSIKTDIELIHKYRDMALQPEAETAINDICNEAIVYDESYEIIKLDVAKLKLPSSIKTKIEEEFHEILRLLNMSKRGYEIFRRWYVDGRIYYHIIVDEKQKKNGIMELRPIDPIKIRKIRKIHKKPLIQGAPTGANLVTSVEEFYVFSENESSTTTSGNIGGQLEGLRISPDAICFAHSGLYDARRKKIIGYLHKAIKSLNQLRMIEDAIVIYRITRAPERRIFYVDVGNLPKAKAEEYVSGLMRRYRNKLIYDPSTGEIGDSRKHLSMIEDFWMPRREGGKGTEITTMPAGQNLGEMDDVKYFQKKLFQALNVPASRLEEQSGFNLGRASEISRDEVKFFKFIERLRMKFSELISELMRVQLILKGVIREDEWKDIESNLVFQFNKDSHFTELKESEVLRDRMTSARDAEDFVGRYYSRNWIRKNILRQTEEDMNAIDAEINTETQEGSIVPQGGQDVNAPPSPEPAGGSKPASAASEQPKKRDVTIGEIVPPKGKSK